MNLSIFLPASFLPPIITCLDQHSALCLGTTTPLPGPQVCPPCSGHLGQVPPSVHTALQGSLLPWDQSQAFPTAPQALHDLPKPFLSSLPCLPPPCSLSSSLTGLLAAPPTRHPRSCPRTFAHASLHLKHLSLRFHGCFLLTIHVFLKRHPLKTTPAVTPAQVAPLLTFKTTHPSISLPLFWHFF